jgi:phosphate transport system substrate-binding protein
VAPTAETINDGTYSPLARPLFIYVRKQAADRAYVKEFVRYYLSEEGRGLAEEVGYIAYPARVYDLALARFESGRAGTVFGGGKPQRGSVAEVLAANQ